MTPDDLAAIRAELAQKYCNCNHLPRLLDNVERLRGLLQRWWDWYHLRDETPCRTCVTGVTVQDEPHHPDCIIERTRAALEDTDHAE